MAVQAQLYRDNVIGGFPVGGPPQDYCIVDNNGCIGGGGDNVGYNESRFNLQQRYQQQQQQQRNSNMFFQNSFCSSKANPATINNANQYHQSMPATTMAFPSQGSAAALVEEQRQEIDRFITLQNERLRVALQVQTRQLFAALISKVESKTAPLLRQKDEEIAQASKKTMELENFLRKLEMENQSWQRAAEENEAMVLSLNNSLEELRERASNSAEMDAESCCDMNLADAEEGTGENRGNAESFEEDRRGRKMVCGNCNSESSCVMFLPCRHLCSCKGCESFLRFCPICRTAKKASMEVFIS